MLGKGTARWRYGLILLGWLGLVLSPGLAGAASTRGFVISPAFKDISIAEGRAEVPYTLRLTNHAGFDQNFRLSVVDFGSLDESGGVAFLGTPSSELDHHYGLASWIRLEQDAIFIPAGQTVQVMATIENRPSLAPGGHYGAILATAVTDAGGTTPDLRVGVKQVLSSLMLVTKEGGVEHNLVLVSQTANSQAWHLPTLAVQRFQNAGNVHVVPRGVAEVRDPLGHVLARGALNEASGEILPESFRQYSTKLIKVGPGWLPGRYSLVATYRYDGTDKTKTFTTHFWYAGLLIVWIVGLGGLGAIGVLGWWLRRRRA
jgi:hypothetical protein